MKKNRKIAGLLFIILLMGAAAFMLVNRKGHDPMYKTVPASMGRIVSSITATGTVNPVTTVLVGTQVSGTIKNIYADYNSVVRKGQLLALIDPTTFDAQLSEAKANYLSARAGLDKALATEADAKRTLRRNKELISKNLIAQSDYDTAQTNYETAKASVEAAKAQVSQTLAAMKFAQTNVRYTRIISPVNGTVVARNVDVGQTVAASFQTPTLFSVAQDLKKMQIDTSVDEADIGNVKTGQNVEFTVDAYPETTFRGKVTQVRINPTIVQNVVTYDVVVSVDNEDLLLKPGMTANVKIITAIKKDVLRVPNTAFLFRLPGYKASGEKGGPGVWVLEQGKPRRVLVNPGLTDGNYTEVASGKLRQGDAVIVEALGKTKDRAPFAHGPRMF